jgi:predicted phage terminase large subunit-like protein
MTLKWTKYIPISPTDKQFVFLLADNVKELFYGGAAGGGKSYALIAGALQYVDRPGYNALLLRRTFADLAKPKALMDIAFDWLSGTDAKWSGQNRRWTFPSGATLGFGYLETDRDIYQYQGGAYQYIAFDELTQFTEVQYRYLFSRLRKPIGLNIPLRMRSASNPGGDGHEWVKQRFLTERSPNRMFIPAKLQDNPHLDQVDYTESLNELPSVMRQQLLCGDWDIRMEGGLFKRSWFSIVEDYPHDANIVRYWDLAATEEGDYTVGCKMAEKDGKFYVLDVKRVRTTPMNVERVVAQCASEDGHSVLIYIEQEPGQSGNAQMDNYIRKVLLGYVTYPDKKTGNKITMALPVSASAEHGNIYILKGTYITQFLDELEAFPETTHDDQVDAMSGAFNALVKLRMNAVRQIGTIDFKW